MCLIFLAYRTWPGYPLVVAANRDEFHDRPTRALHVWDDDDNVLGGRDLLAGGGWMATTLDGRFAALTNYRSGKPLPADPRSRGAIVSDFVRGDYSIASYRSVLEREADAYVGFSALFYRADKLGFYSNCAAKDANKSELPAGVYGLSNALLDTPWPKVESGKQTMGKMIADGPPRVTALLDMMADRDLPSDQALPNTGVGVERERELAPRFIHGEVYGTRTSSVLLVHDSGEMQLTEQSYSPAASPTNRVDFQTQADSNGRRRWQHC